MKPTHLLLFLFLPLFSRADFGKGLVASYNFNDATVRDETGRHNAKAVGISYVTDRFGNPRSSCYLHGDHGSYVNLGTSPELKPTEASISLWINIDIPMYGGRGYSVNPIILTKNDTTSDFFEAYAISYQYVLKKLVVATTHSQLRQVTVHSAEIFPLNEWHHVMITYDDDYVSFYIDGKLDSRMGKHFRSRFLATDSVLIGNSANTRNQRFLCASVDDIQIYNRVLSAQEVKEVFNAPDPNRYHVYYKWFLRGLITLVILMTIMWLLMKRYRRDLERQKERNRINALLNEFETKAIRTQMNPHFIFNSLNTLQSFILEEDIENSNLYLTKFSSLLRKLIESSVSDSISLVEEIDILNRYIEIEKLRFDHSFDYQIFAEIPQPESVFVPFMLVQPFVENAIWHGLLPKKGNCFLSVKFSELDKERIKCIVDDNGLGRQPSTKQHTIKKRSLATEFIRQRLELLEKSTGISCGFRIIDKKDAAGNSLGTTVEVIIPKLTPDDTYRNNRR
jgi:hypothetical protein